MKRLDTADKLNGSKVYAIDVKLPGMLNAAIKDAPVFGSKLMSYDESKIADRPGVKKVVKVGDTAVAVVADTWWHAKSALDALPIVWDEGDNAKVSDADHRRASQGRLDGDRDQRRPQEWRCAQGHRGAAKKVEAVYCDAVPVPCLHGADELHGALHARQGGSLGAVAERRGLARGAVGSLRPADRQMRRPPHRSRRRLRPAWWHAGLHASGHRPSPRNSPAPRSS